MIKGVIFDLDGVLVSTDIIHYECWKYITDKNGIHFDENVNSSIKGMSRMGCLDYILKYNNIDLSIEEKEKLCDEKNNKYIERLNKMSSKDVSHDLLKILDYLKHNGYKLAVASPSKNCKLILEKLGLIKYFEVICDGYSVERFKPDPEVFLKAQSLLGLNIDECIIVEDALNGIDAAYSGGFKSIGIKDASFYNKTTFKIKSLIEIIDIVKNI